MLPYSLALSLLQEDNSRGVATNTTKIMKWSTEHYFEAYQIFVIQNFLDRARTYLQLPLRQWVPAIFTS